MYIYTYDLLVDPKQNFCMAGLRAAASNCGPRVRGAVCRAAQALCTLQSPTTSFNDLRGFTSESDIPEIGKQEPHTKD